MISTFPQIDGGAMPTGYTADLEDGKTTDFPTFALRCARAFGALYFMRDSDLSATIPDVVEPCPYHEEKRARLDAERAVILRMSNAECDDRAGAEYTKSCESRENFKRRDSAVYERYKAMKERVVAWRPPTADHKGLRDFMLEQIAMCMHEPDGAMKFWTEPDRLTGAAWRDKELARLSKDIEYHRAEYAKDVKRAAESTEWVRVLRESLK